MSIPSHSDAADARPDHPAAGGAAAADAPSVTAEPRTRQAELAPVYAGAIRVLTWGWRLGAALLTVGVALAVGRGEPLDHEAAPFAEVIPAVLAGRADGVVDLAIIWLMATPVAAVLVVGVGFLRHGERCYAFVSLLVLVILGVSIGLALTE